MNPQVRSYLIRHAKIGTPKISYSDLVRDCHLHINLELQEGRNELSKILGDIATFEFKAKRPLLSSLVIYSNNNDHGKGFYHLCELLGIGNARKLEDELFGFLEAANCRNFWQTPANYQTYSDLLQSYETPFFSLEELTFFDQWNGVVYDPSDDSHLSAKERIMKTVWDQTLFLGELIEERSNGLVKKGKRIWHQRGWSITEDKSQQAAIFKGYTWVKLMRADDKGKDIFFTFGIDSSKQAFIYKIDCQHQRDSAMTKAQITRCQQMIPESLRSLPIQYADLLQMNWNQLADFCASFISDNLPVYDEIIAAVWENRLPQAIICHQLFEHPIPPGFTPGNNSRQPGASAPGNEAHDYIQDAIDAKTLGDKGEALVLLHEKRRLELQNKYSLSSKVRKVPDGSGYDILSFDDRENEIKIEVKTTKGGVKTPFYMSDPEYRFLLSKPPHYCIYRLYEYDDTYDIAKFYKIAGNVEGMLAFQPCNYTVSIR